MDNPINTLIKEILGTAKLHNIANDSNLTLWESHYYGKVEGLLFAINLLDNYAKAQMIFNNDLKKFDKFIALKIYDREYKIEEDM